MANLILLLWVRKLCPPPSCQQFLFADPQRFCLQTSPLFLLTDSTWSFRNPAVSFLGFFFLISNIWFVYPIVLFSDFDVSFFQIADFCRWSNAPIFLPTQYLSLFFYRSFWSLFQFSLDYQSPHLCYFLLAIILLLPSSFFSFQTNYWPLKIPQSPSTYRTSTSFRWHYCPPTFGSCSSMGFFFVSYPMLFNYFLFHS